MTKFQNLSTPKKKTDITAAMIKTMIVVIVASLRVGQTTFEISCRIWRTNSAGLVFAIVQTFISFVNSNDEYSITHSESTFI